jgi:hypothetical protein
LPAPKTHHLLACYPAKNWGPFCGSAQSTNTCQIKYFNYKRKFWCNKLDMNFIVGATNRSWKFKWKRRFNATKNYRDVVCD